MDVWWCTVVLLAASSYTGCAIGAVCDSPGRPSVYAIHPRPSEMDPLTNNDTLPPNACFEDATVVGGWLCLENSVILDGNLGFQPSPSSALFFAWNRSSQVVSVTVRYFPQVTIRHVQLFFYNKPSMGIGLPDITLASTRTLPHYITGNQHLRSDDDGRRNVTLSLVDTSERIGDFSVNFSFSDSNRVDWLLLSEVRICQQPVTVLKPLATPQLVNAISVVRNASDVSASLNLSCTVSGEGRFSWMWTGPSPLSQVVLSDYTRTSTALFTDIRKVEMTKYHCQATYDPQIAGGMFAMSASQDFNVALEFVLDVVGPSTVRAALLEEVSLTCELYGYLESSDTVIIWTIENVEIGDSNSLYRVDTMNGNNSIQNGGAISLPSIVSVLTISANDSSRLTTYVCKVAGTIILKTITLMRMESITSGPPDVTKTDPETTSPNSTTTVRNIPETTSISTIVIIGVVGGLFLLIIVIFIAILIVILLSNRHSVTPRFRLHSTKRKDSLDFNGDPFYQELSLSKPNPPPIPAHFPSQSMEIQAYASVCQIKQANGFVDMGEGNRASVQSIAVSSPVVLADKLPFLERNPIYDSSDNFADDCCRSSVPPMDNNQLNIYTLSTRMIPPPIPNRLPTPELFEEPIYSEAGLKPELFASNISNNTLSTESEVMPCFSIYDDPEPLLRSEAPKEISLENVRELKNLGVGQFGEVVLAETVGLSLKDLHLDENDDNKDITVQVAMKGLKCSADLHIKEAFEKEIKFMSRLHCRNVVRLLAICPGSNPFILMEYMSNGDLNQFIKNHEHAKNEDGSWAMNSLTCSELIFISLQIASGMKYLASFRFIHRDLATRNCLVGDNLEIKIADFGMSRSLYTTYYYRISGRAMLPIRWMANECFYGKFSEKTDVWAFGVTMWEMFKFVREQPYQNMTDQEVIDDAIKGADRMLLSQPDCCPVEVYEVMKKCWVDNPPDRARFSEVHSLLYDIYENGQCD